MQITVTSLTPLTPPAKKDTRRRAKRSAYQIIDRQKWTDKDYYSLLQHSFLGKSRHELHLILDREPGKIFSKIQKHMRTVDIVRDMLQQALSDSKERVTVSQMEAAKASAFQWVIRYLATAKGFVQYIKTLPK